MKNNFIVWQKEWETGIVKIDEQHKHFVGIINRTYALDKEGKTKEKLEPILNDLMEYARIHFSTEEEYFEETDYPETKDHEDKHQELLAKVIKFNNKFEKTKEVSEMVEEFLLFLKDWLDNHLIEVDHRYIKWLNEHGIK